MMKKVIHWETRHINMKSNNNQLRRKCEGLEIDIEELTKELEASKKRVVELDRSSRLSVKGKYSQEGLIVMLFNCLSCID